MGVISSGITAVNAHSYSAGFIVVLFSFVCLLISFPTLIFLPLTPSLFSYPVFSYPFTSPPSLPPTSSLPPLSLLFLSFLTIPLILLFSLSLLCSSNSLNSWSSMYQGTWCPPYCGPSLVTARWKVVNKWESSSEVLLPSLSLLLLFPSLTMRSEAPLQEFVMWPLNVPIFASGIVLHFMLGQINYFESLLCIHFHSESMTVLIWSLIHYHSNHYNILSLRVEVPSAQKLGSLTRFQDRPHLQLKRH